MFFFAVKLEDANNSGSKVSCLQKDGVANDAKQFKII